MLTLLNAQNLALKSNAQFFDIFGKFLSGFGSNSCYMDFDVLQNIIIAFFFFALLADQEMGLGIQATLYQSTVGTVEELCL